MLALALVSACSLGEPPLGDLHACPGLVCPTESILDGNSSISGLAGIDTFFASVISLRDASKRLSDQTNEVVASIGASLNHDVSDESPSDAVAQVAFVLGQHLDAHLEGSLSISATPVQCDVSASAAVEISASCDASAEGSVALCDGSCTVPANEAANCQAQGSFFCEGPAAEFACTGVCTGTCQLEVAASCDGTCEGSCEGSCTSCAGDVCETDGAGAITNCAGSCAGSCQGTCELAGGGACEGRCEGSCFYEAELDGCESSSVAHCQSPSALPLECAGSCDGRVIAPEVSAECKAATEAKLAAQATCTPPSLSFQYRFRDEVSADERAAFRAWLRRFESNWSTLLALQIQAVRLGTAAAQTIEASGTTVEVFVETSLYEELSLRDTIGLGCALSELSLVGGMMTRVAVDAEHVVQSVSDLALALGE